MNRAHEVKVDRFFPCCGVEIIKAASRWPASIGHKNIQTAKHFGGVAYHALCDSGIGNIGRLGKDRVAALGVNGCGGSLQLIEATAVDNYERAFQTETPRRCRA